MDLVICTRGQYNQAVFLSSEKFTDDFRRMRLEHVAEIRGVENCEISRLQFRPDHCAASPNQRMKLMGIREKESGRFSPCLLFLN